MRMLLLWFAALVATSAVAGDYDGLASVELSVQYVDSDDRPLDDRYLPASVGLRIKPIPGSLYGIPLGVDLLNVESDEAGTLSLDLQSIDDKLAAIALPIVPVGEFETITIDPPDVRVVRLGTFSYPTSDAEFRASTGLGVLGDDVPTPMTLVYFDRPVRIEGVGQSDGYTITYDLQVAEAGVAWVEMMDPVDNAMRVTDRRTAGPEALTIHVREFTYLPVIREQGGYRLFDQFFAIDDVARLPESLSKYPGKQVLVTGATNITVGDMTTLLPVLQGAGYKLLFRDGDGNIHPVDVEEGL